MSVEIERKYLVVDTSWKENADKGVACKQAYLISDRSKTVRIRCMADKSYLTVKGATIGLSRPEFEYEIPRADAEAMLALCGPVVEKTRYHIPHGGMIWELDVFQGANEGLIIAEIELASEDQSFALPEWAGDEVTHDRRYYNGYLAKYPFAEWE